LPGNVVERPAGTGGSQPEQDARGWREAPDVQPAIDEESDDRAGSVQVLDVFTHLRTFVDLGLEVVIDGGQLLVHRLDFFQAGLQFLDCNLQLGVVGREFEAGRPKRFARPFELRDPAAKFLPESPAFLRTVFGSGAFIVRRLPRLLGRRHRLQDDQAECGSDAGLPMWNHPDVDRAALLQVSPLPDHRNAPGLHRHARPGGLQQCRAQLQAQVRMDVRHQRRAWCAGCVNHELPGT
jgi:hypothetical protein